MSVINERDWAAKTAMRLRVVQASMAESDEVQDRGSTVWEFIAQALNELGDVDERFRLKYLRALDEEFPFYQDRLALDQSGSVLDLTPTKTDTTKKVESQTFTPEELLKQLLAAAANLTEAQIQEFSSKLVKGGYKCAVDGEGLQGNASAMPVTMPTYQEEFTRLTKTVEKIQSTIGSKHFKSGASLNLIRSLQMLGLMSEQYILLHPQIWEMWEKIVTNQQYTTSFNRPALSPAEALAKFLEGAQSSKRADVGQMVAKTFYLTSALVASVENTGREFVSWFIEKFGAENIESLANFEAGEKSAGPAQYWKRYQELTELHSADELCEQFHNLLGKNMLRQIQRRPGI